MKIYRVWVMAGCALALGGCGATANDDTTAPSTNFVTLVSTTSGAGGINPQLSATVCGEQVAHSFGGDERIVVLQNSQLELEALFVLDGEVFDIEDEAAWQDYAADYDTLLQIGFANPEPAAPHKVTRVFDSLFAGTGTGTILFVEHGLGEIVDLTALEMGSQTIEFEFTIPIAVWMGDYPPDFATGGSCTEGTATGSFSGSFDLMTR